MDNNEVYSLFEDIKNDLKSINGKLENAPKVTNNQPGGQPTAVDLTPIKELFDSSAREHQAQTKAMLTKFAEAEVYASNRILHLLRALKECGGNRKQAALRLGISRSTLWRRLKEWE